MQWALITYLMSADYRKNEISHFDPSIVGIPAKSYRSVETKNVIINQPIGFRIISTLYTIWTSFYGKCLLKLQENN